MKLSLSSKVASIRTNLKRDLRSELEPFKEILDGRFIPTIRTSEGQDQLPRHLTYQFDTDGEFANYGEVNELRKKAEDASQALSPLNLIIIKGYHLKLGSLISGWILGSLTNIGFAASITIALTLFATFMYANIRYNLTKMTNSLTELKRVDALPDGLLERSSH